MTVLENSEFRVQPQASRWQHFQQRWQSWITEPPEPPLVCEIAADYVTALRHRNGHVEAWASRPLPAGAVRPGPLSDNITDPAPVQEALEQVLGAVNGSVRRCVLIVPDLLARVVLVDLERVPQRADEAEELLRWRLRKEMPFDLHQARLSYQVQPGRDGGQEVLVAVCLRTLLRQYEERLEAAGVEPGWVTLSLLATLGWMGDSESEARLLVKRSPESLSVAITQGGAIRLFRSVPMRGAGDQDQLEERLFQKIFPALVHFREQSGEVQVEARLCGSGPETAGLAQRLESEAGCTAQVFEVDGLDLPPSPFSGAQPDHTLLPGLGWVKGRVS